MDTTPLAEDLWQGIGGHFDTFSQIVCEFIDNAVSVFEAKNTPNKTINIFLCELSEEYIGVKVEDSGTGIPDFLPVLRLGDKSQRLTPLNEHGFGLKHAIASANPENDNWRILTRTSKDFQRGQYRQVSSSYRFTLQESIVSLSKTPWPGIVNGSGTLIEFTCSRSLFNTIRKGIRGPVTFQGCVEALKEELGFIYSGVIKKGRAILNIHPEGGRMLTVEAVEPNWVGFYKPGQNTIAIDLGGGTLNLEYSFGEMEESNHLKHYKRNMSTSGVEIRLNGRLLVNNLFKEIWGLENHPSYNHFLAIINLASKDLNALPRTRTSKNGIRSGDQKLENLFQWIRNVHGTPSKQSSGAASERELVKELADLKEKHLRHPDKRIQTEFPVFNTLGSTVPVDLYVFDGKDVVLYEAKKDTADIQAVYQLLMYWDGAIVDQLKPTEGILLASEFTNGAQEMVKLINTFKDQNGNTYRFSMKTWNDEGIKYPRP